MSGISTYDNYRHFYGNVKFLLTQVGRKSMRKESGKTTLSVADDAGKFNPVYWEPEFWTGYRRGLNRRRYGEIYGNPAEHRSWHDIPENLDQEPSIERVAWGMGYRAGFAGLTVEEAAEKIMEFIKVLKGK
jgi:hypothetical protein